MAEGEEKAGSLSLTTDHNPQPSRAKLSDCLLSIEHEQRRRQKHHLSSVEENAPMINPKSKGNANWMTAASVLMVATTPPRTTATTAATSVTMVAAASAVSGSRTGGITPTTPVVVEGSCVPPVVAATTPEPENPSSPTSKVPPVVENAASERIAVVAAAERTLLSRIPRCGGDGPPSEDAGGEKTSKKKKSSRRKASTSSSHNKRKPPKESPAAAPPPPPPPPTPPIVQEILQEEDYYKVLGLPKGGASITGDQIKKAYRRRALQTHPDKTNGDRRAFDKVTAAYEVLSDDNKRRLYDRFGKRGLEEMDQPSGFAGAGFANAEDLLRSFFGGGGGHPFQQQQQQARRTNRTVRYRLTVSLEDLYRGATRDVRVSAPSPPSAWHVPPRHGSSSKHVSVDIPRGTAAGESVVLSGAMDLNAEETPGDLIFHIQQRQHPVYTRKGHDLAVALRIRLSEAIRGVRRTLEFLDGRSLVIASAVVPPTTSASSLPGLLVQDGEVQVLKGYGMPKDAQGSEFGDLYVQFHISLPAARSDSRGGSVLSESERLELGRLLNKLEGVDTEQQEEKNSKAADPLYLQKSVFSDFGQASGTRDEPSTEEDDPRPKAGGGRRFYYSSSFSQSSSNPFFRGDNPFTSTAGDDDEGDGVQCQQM